MGGFIQPIFLPLVEIGFIRVQPQAIGCSQHWIRHCHGKTPIERTVQALGYELVDAERAAGGLLRVFIDRVGGRTYEPAPASA